MRVEPGWRPTRIIVASGNAHKIRELGQMLREALPELDVDGQHSFGEPPSIEESADDFMGNARLKAQGIAAWLRQLRVAGDSAVLADDSGVSVDALGGAPGVRSARFAGEHATDADNNDKLVAELRARDRVASAGYYSCVLALTRVDGRPFSERGEPTRCFEGRWDVELRTDARGSGGFGYDPHAWLPDGRTVAELSPADKGERSHRGAATAALLGWLKGFDGASPAGV